MQGKVITLDGSGKATVTAPCPLEAVDLICAAHTFTVQYVDDTAAAGALGDAVAAAQISATYFEFKLDRAPRTLWSTGQTMCLIVGTAADTIYMRPRRPSR